MARKFITRDSALIAQFAVTISHPTEYALQDICIDLILQATQNQRIDGVECDFYRSAAEITRPYTLGRAVWGEHGILTVSPTVARGNYDQHKITVIIPPALNPQEERILPVPQPPSIVQAWKSSTRSEGQFALWRSEAGFNACMAERNRHGKPGVTCADATIALVAKGTKTQKLGGGWSLLRVKIMEGPNAGAVGWIPMEFHSP